MHHLPIVGTRQILQVVLAAALMMVAVHSRAAEPATYSWGVLNQQSPAQTAALWNPILTYLGNKTGLKFRLRMGSTVQETDLMSKRGEFDFLYNNHIFDPEFDDANYRPLAQWGGKPLVGQIVVNVDSPLRTLKDLEGKKVVFPSRDAFIAYQVTRDALRKAGVRIEEVFGANQNGAAVQLASGRADAASLNKFFANRFQTEGKGKFRPLYESGAWPNIPVLAHPRIPDKDASAVRQALLDMSTDPEGKALLENLKIPGFLPVKDSDYNATRRMYRENP